MNNLSSSSENSPYARPSIRKSPRLNRSPDLSLEEDQTSSDNEENVDAGNSSLGSVGSDSVPDSVLENASGSIGIGRPPPGITPQTWSSILLVLVLAVSALSFSLRSAEPCKKSVEALEADFPGQSDSLWTAVRAVLEYDPRGPQTSTILLLHSPAQLAITLCIAHRIATTFACHMFNNTTVTRITPNDVNIDVDYGVIIENYRSKNLSVIVENTTQIHYEKANAFHVLCDDIIQFSPPSLYVFLLEREDTSLQARDILEEAWGELPNSKLDPLLSRVIGYVIPINNEEKIVC